MDEARSHVRVTTRSRRGTGKRTPTPAGAEDPGLARSVAAGDANALGRVYDLHASLVYGVLLRMLQSAAAAEELLQEVFWALWTHPERFDPERGGLRVYLFQLARSRALDSLRRERRRGELLRGHPAMISEPREHLDPSNPFLAAVSEQDRSRVREALADLPVAQQRVLALSFFDGLSHSEIAEHLGEPLGTVKTRIRGGLARMRVRLGGDESERSWNEV